MPRSGTRTTRTWPGRISVVSRHAVCVLAQAKPKPENCAGVHDHFGVNFKETDPKTATSSWQITPLRRGGGRLRAHDAESRVGLGLSGRAALDGGLAAAEVGVALQEAARADGEWHEHLVRGERHGLDAAADVGPPLAKRGRLPEAHRAAKEAELAAVPCVGPGERTKERVGEVVNKHYPATWRKSEPIG